MMRMIRIAMGGPVQPSPDEYVRSELGLPLLLCNLFSPNSAIRNDNPPEYKPSSAMQSNAETCSMRPVRTLRYWFPIGNTQILRAQTLVRRATLNCIGRLQLCLCDGPVYRRAFFAWMGPADLHHALGASHGRRRRGSRVRLGRRSR